MNQSPGPPRRKHLMDPHAPRPKPSQADLDRLTRVQRNVASALAFTTVLHLALGLVLAARYVPEDRTGSRIGLVVIATISLVLGVAAVLAIHRRRVLSPWLLAGLLPALAGAWWVFQG